MSQTPRYAYFVPAEHMDRARVLEVLHGIGLDQAWIRTGPTQARYEEHELLQVEIYDLAEGLPVFVDSIGPTLSQAASLALTVGFDPNEQEAALQLNSNGEELFAWAGQFHQFEARDEEGNELKGEEGFKTVFEDLVGHGFEAFLDACPFDDEAREVADERTDLLIRGRVMGLPEGMPRLGDLFAFHQEEDEDEDAQADEGDDRVALALLDLRLTEVLWTESPAQEVVQFIKAIEAQKSRVLGPLASDLEQALEWVESQPPTRPLAQATHPDLTTYEILAMATALAYTGGTPVQRLDERFLPLLSLAQADGAITADVLRDSIEDIEGMGVLSAMAEVLPYSVPEGEVLECFDDEELAPLAAWGVKGQEYEGSLLLLDVTRLVKLLEDFDLDRLKARAEEFQRAWFEAAPGSVTSFESWQLVRPQDEADWDRFLIQLGELKLVLGLLTTNQLTPALLFYGT